MHMDLLTGIGLAICTAAVFALVARKIRQPLLLAYLAAGIVIGPIGFGMIKDQETIHAVSEIGLILLLFIIGLEIDIKKLAAAGKSLIAAGILQFLISVPVGVGFFLLLGFAMGNGRFDVLYLSVALALSSTMIVVKMLYDKNELPTLPGRLSLGVLVFQDLWAILFLSLQPNLLDPRLSVIALSLIKGVALVAAGLLLARHVLTQLFASIGLGLKHIDMQVIGILAFVFAIASVGSTYTIQYNNQIQSLLAKGLRALGVKDLGEDTQEAATGGRKGDMVFLGFFRDASAIFHELERMPGPDGLPLSAQTHVIDFSPVVYAELSKRGVPCTYGDISSLDTLHHAGLHGEKVIACTIADTVLRGTSNQRLLQSLRHLCPQSFIMVTAETLPAAKALYDQGADFVFIPRIHSAKDVAATLADALHGRAGGVKDEQRAMLADRIEVLA